MSEFAPIQEKHESILPSPERREALPTAEQAEPLRAGEKDPQQALAEAHHAVQEAAIDDGTNPVEKLRAVEAASSSTTPLHAPNRELKAITLNRELKTIRRKESAPQRALSNIIHQPAIRAASEAAGKTISRPSGLLGGGLVAALGSGGYLYLAKHIGFQYNYLVSLLLFVAGFGFGLILELAVWSLTAARRRAD